MALRFTRGPRKFSYAEIYASIGVIAVVVAWLFPHVTVIQRAWPSCSFREFTGYPCASCGMTRAFVRSAYGEFESAFSVTPLGFLLFWAMVTFSVVTLATWAIPALPRPQLTLETSAAKWSARVLPAVIVAINWLWLCWQTFTHGAPPA